MADSSIPAALKRRATAWAGQLTKMARELAPAHVQPAISSHIEEKENGTFIIRITADRSVAPDARAQEYGSGLHARRGPKHLIPILPKSGKYLAFFWEVATNSPESFRMTPDGKVLLTSVKHPGIEAANEGKGYIAPAVNELRSRGRAELDTDVRQAILSDIRRSFGHANQR